MGRAMRNLTVEEKRMRLLFFARKHQGKPYRYGAWPAEAPKVFDCSSFTQYLYRRIGIELPRRSYEQATLGAVVSPPLKANLAVGDLLFFTGSQGRYGPEFPEGVGHAAMYVGDGQIVHATQTKSDGPNGGAVRIVRLSRRLARGDFVIAKRLLAP